MLKLNPLRKNTIISKPVNMACSIADAIMDNCDTLEDVEGYVYNCLLSDDGEAGAEFYETTQPEFKRIVLDTMDDVFDWNK